MGSDSAQDLSTLLRDIIARRDEDGSEEPAEFLTALITSAVHDETPKYSLKDICSAIVNTGATQYLDALNVLASLVESNRDGAVDLIDLLSECGSAKEIVIATQESLEHLRVRLENSDEGDDQLKPVSTSLGNILSLCIGSIPRLKLPKKSPAETIRPLIKDLGQTLPLAGKYLGKAEGQEIMGKVCELISTVIKWTGMLEQRSTNDAADGESIPHEVLVLCRELLIRSLESFSPFLSFNLAQRKFEKFYPRLLMKSTSSAKSDTRLLLEINATAGLLLISTDDLLKTHSIGGLILLAYGVATPSSSISLPATPTLLKTTLPLLISSLQSAFALDETLFILLTALHSPSCPPTLDPDVITPLISTIAPLASTNPSPQTRLITFKILGKLLSRIPPLDRMYILRDLLSDSEDNFPPMRVAAVGLLKEAVLEALSKDEKNAFASPVLFEVIVGELFRFDTESKTLSELAETGETKRFVEMLSFYYVLLVRDTANRTGVRDASNIKAITSNFLTPLRLNMAAWNADAESDHDQQFALISLDIALQRVEEQLATLQK